MSALYWGAILPALYALVVAPHALIGRPGIPRTAIVRTLIAKWNNAEDLAQYIITYWMAFAYPDSSWKKRRNAVTLYLTAFFLCGCYFLKDLFVPGVFMFAAGYVLYQMSLRVDRPRLIYANREFRDKGNPKLRRAEWELAAMSTYCVRRSFPGRPRAKGNGKPDTGGQRREKPAGASSLRIRRKLGGWLTQYLEQTKMSDSSHVIAYVIGFDKVRMSDVGRVGGKNASLGEMITQLAQAGVRVPGGFATTADAYRDFLSQQGLAQRIEGILGGWIRVISEPWLRPGNPNTCMDKGNALAAEARARDKRCVRGDCKGSGNR